MLCLLLFCIAHEWSKHGTCSGLSQFNYLSSAINVIKKFGTPAIIPANLGKNISSDALRQDFGGAEYVSLQCMSGQYLSGAFLCLTFGSDGLPGDKVVCPADVHAEDTCTGSTVFIQTF